MAKQSRISNTQRRLAADILKCGDSRVWMDPSAGEKIKRAITRNDVRGLIADGLISKVRAKVNGRRKHGKQERGSRKGASGARRGLKEKWLKMVRPQRQLLSEMRPAMKPLAYRKTYMLIKGGVFRSRAHLQAYLKEKKLLEEK
jgi:large subunit ribosomal protein L19e